MLLHQLIALLLITLTNGIVLKDCPLLSVNPAHLLVEYGKSITVTCKPVTTAGMSIIDFGWNVSSGSSLNKTSFGNWTKLEVQNLTDCEFEIKCFLMTKDIECHKTVPLTVYKVPDRVSLSILGHDGFLIEGNQYAMQCVIENMAAEIFNMNWYEGENPLSQTSCSGYSRNPMSHTFTHVIEPRFSGSVHQYRCETEQKVGPEENLQTSSSPLNIEVKDCFAILEPPAVMVEYGHSVSASCSTDLPNIRIGWEAPLGAIDPVQRRNVTWSVNDVNIWEIKPICFYTNKLDTQCLFDLPVTIYKRPDSVSISTAGHTGPMVVGREYTLQCHIQNVFSINYTVFWYIDNLLINQENVQKSKLKRPENSTHSLQFSPKKTLNNSIQYRCKVKLNLGPEGPQPPPSVTSAPLDIIVHYAPIINCPETYEVEEQNLFQPNCSIMASPDAQVIWSKDGEMFNQTHLLTWSDGGLYEMMAQNPYGTRNHSLTVTVMYGPIIDCPKSYDVKEHELFQPNCSVGAFPKAQVTWKTNGAVVNLLQPLTRNHRGTYEINAWNKNGRKRSFLFVNVLYGAKLTSFSSDISANGDTNVPLHCYAEGNPEPEVTLSFKNQSKSTGRQNAMMISSDSGEYTCTAVNKFGSDTRTLRLSIAGTISKAMLFLFICIPLILLLCIIVYYCYCHKKKTGQYNVIPNGIAMSKVNHA